MKLTKGDLLGAVLWGGLVTIILNIINPSQFNFIVEFIIVFLIGGFGAIVGG
ncbi:hypothetical protein [Priestia abyssalis]|uniref:hypothetical protein n=1 Tax=Priestia abyssalis TaxID=1221450 RepID=UPI001475E670|nr:hypothetical protein [Priestia abyssalis]